MPEHLLTDHLPQMVHNFASIAQRAVFRPQRRPGLLRPVGRFLRHRLGQNTPAQHRQHPQRHRSRRYPPEPSASNRLFTLNVPGQHDAEHHQDRHRANVKQHLHRRQKIDLQQHELARHQKEERHQKKRRMNQVSRRHRPERHQNTQARNHQKHRAPAKRSGKAPQSVLSPPPKSPSSPPRCDSRSRSLPLSRRVRHRGPCSNSNHAVRGGHVSCP